MLIGNLCENGCNIGAHCLIHLFSYNRLIGNFRRNFFLRVTEPMCDSGVLGELSVQAHPGAEDVRAWRVQGGRQVMPRAGFVRQDVKHVGPRTERKSSQKQLWEFHCSSWPWVDDVTLYGLLTGVYVRTGWPMRFGFHRHCLLAQYSTLV